MTPSAAFAGSVVVTFQMPRGRVVGLKLSSRLVAFELDEPVELRFDDGTSRRGRIAGLGMRFGPDLDPEFLSVLLSKEFDGIDLPLGTAVWKLPAPRTSEKS